MDVVVSNTNTQIWEFEKYIEYANIYGCTIKVVRCTGEFGNVHDVPHETILRMKNRFQDYEGEEII
jgi:hypothetical protein